MRLRHLSLGIILLSALGMVALLGIGYFVAKDLQHQRAELESLLILQQRIETFSMASESALLYPPAPPIRRLVEKEARAVQSRLLDLDARHPGAGRLVRYIDLILDLVEKELDDAGMNGEPTASSPRTAGPLRLPRRSRDILTQLTGHDAALQSALVSLIRERQVAVSQRGDQAFSAFFGAAMLLGMLCILGFVAVHRRLTLPVAEVVDVIHRIGGGDRAARVRFKGRDELADMAKAFNELLDRQHASERELLAYEQELEETNRLLSESQRIASLGSLRLHIPSNTLDCSPETFHIFGLDSDRWASTPHAFFQCIHPQDSDRFLAERSRALSGEADLDIQYRICRPDGELRHVRQRAIVELGEDGRPEYLVGTVQDITEYKETSQALEDQRRLLDVAGRVARFGGWWVDAEKEVTRWSDGVCDIHEVPHGTQPSLDEAINYYAPECREKMARLYRDCVRFGEAFDEELQLITASGRRIWVRATGEAVHDASGKLTGAQGSLQDISDFKRNQLRVERLGRQFHLILNNLNEAFFLLDRDWRFTYLNPQAEHFLRKAAGEVLGKQLWAIYPDLEDGPVGRAYRRSMETGVSLRVDDFYYPPLEGWFDIRVYAFEEGLAVFFEDVTARHTLIQRLRDQEQALRHSGEELASALGIRKTLINSLPAHIALLDADGVIEDVNDYWRRFARENDFPDQRHGVGMNYLAVCQGNDAAPQDGCSGMGVALEEILQGRRDAYATEYACHAPEQERWFRVMANRLSGDGNSGIGGAVVMHLDITERKQAERELNRLAFEDVLTHVHSRTGFTRALDERLSSEAWDAQGMVVVLDLVNLRHVNDVHGYAVGDQLLVQVAQRLRQAVGEDGLVGRTGGDEFMAYLSGRGGVAKARRRQTLERVFAAAFGIGGYDLEVTSRFGYTQLKNTPRAAEALLREAELALFHGRASKDGRNWFAYTAALDKESRERMALAGELRQALAQDEFELYFQPKVDMKTGQVVAAEALIRWNHPERGLISPAHFIPVAEQSQLIGPIGDWVLESACRNLSEWQTAGLDIVQIAVNVSLSQFSLGNFSQRVRQTLRRNRVRGSALSLEITESVFGSEEYGLARHLKALSDLGIRLSLDDFGTGYSSLLYLQKYPFDEIKIDRGFVSRMLKDQYSQEIVRTVIGVAELIEASVVAEGVETTAERDVLLAMGCWVGQGYLYSRPLPAAEFRRLLERRQSLPEGGDTA